MTDAGFSFPRLLDPTDVVERFDSGEPALDDWLKKRAVKNQVEGAARTYVSCSDGRVVGYYALSTTSVLRDAGTSRIRRGMPDPIPAILLGRLAVDRHYQSHGLGRSLLQDAIRRTLGAAETIGVRVLLVHALREEVRGFYLRYGFETSPTDPLHVMLLLKDARAALESASG